MEKFKVQCKTIEIKSDLSKRSWEADILIDGESLFDNGKGITKVIYEGESIGLPQLIIEGDLERMTEFIKKRLIPVEEKRTTIIVDIEPQIKNVGGLGELMANIARAEIKKAKYQLTNDFKAKCEDLESVEDISNKITKGLQSRKTNF